MAAEPITLATLMGTFPHTGTVQWIGVRPARQIPMSPLQHVTAKQDLGLVGDRYRSRGGKRQVTLIQAEHLAVVAQLTRRAEVRPEALRRNIVVAGINLSTLIGFRFRIGAAVLEATGACHPCSRMEEALGPGGYQAMRGHGGITAGVVESGEITLGDAVVVLGKAE